MRRLRTLRATACALVAAAATALASACSGTSDTTAPGGRPVTSRVALAASVGPIAQTSAGAATLRVGISYLRVTGDTVALGTQTFPLANAGTQQIPITVDLASCLNDANHRGADLGTGANAVCVLRFDLSLLSGTTLLDREAVGPVTARPGQTTAVDQPVALYTVSTVSIAPTTGGTQGGAVRLAIGQTVTLAATALDAAGQPVTSRTPRWTSDAPNVATVDSLSGVVTPQAPGRATITAIVGGRSANIVVNVVPASAAISVTVAGGAGSGTITSAPAGINCQVTNGAASGTCSFTFPGDAAVTLTATPATGSSFASWGGDCATAGTLLTCTLTPAVPRSAAVTFVAFRALSVALAGTGDGTVTSAPAGITCQLTAGAVGSTSGTTSGTCSAPFLDGTAVTLTAAPGATSTFAGWSGACATAALTCTVTLTQAQSVTATFTRRQATLTLTLGGSGAGTVTASGAGVAGNGTCTLAAGAGSTTCTIPVQVGAAVTLTATAGQASAFTAWAGACSAATGATCTLTVNADASVGAVFTLLPVPLSITPAAGNAGAGTVTTADNAINCAIGGATANGTCTANTPVGSTVTLRAAPAAGQVFLGWGGACASSGTAASCTLTVGASTNVTVAFGAPQTLTLTLSGTGGGRVTGASAPCTVGTGAGPVTCTPSQTYGSTLTLAATPDSASTFGGWTGACSGTASCTVTLDQARTVGATFTRRRATLTLALGGSGNGRVSVNGTVVCTIAAGQNSQSCTAPVDLYSTVTVTGAPSDAGSYFVGWGGTCPSGGTTQPCTFVVTGDRAIAATFNLNPATLAVAPTAGNAGAGTVTFAGNTCAIGGTTANGTCSANFDIGASVTLAETPSNGQVFLGWGGACASAGTAPTCTVTVRGAATATVAFGAPQTLTLTLSGSGGAGGNVTGVTPPCVLNGGSGSVTCTPAFPFGATVTLTANPDSASSFGGWGGACAASGSSPTCSVVLDQARTVTATFLRRTASIVIALSGSAGGSVGQGGQPECTLPSGGGSANCQVTAALYSSQTFIAQPNSGAQFSGWSGPCTGAGSCTFTVTGNTTLGATFVPAPVTVTLAPGGTGNGTLSGPPPGQSQLGPTCTYDASNGQVSGQCGANYPAGSTVTFTATPVSGGIITAWTGACAATSASSSTCTVTVNQALTVGVQFAGPYTIGVTTASGTFSGNGTVTGTGGIDCSFTGSTYGGTCSAAYTAGQTITYTANPDSRSYFTGWSSESGAYCGGQTTLQCTFTASGSNVARLGFATASIFELDAGNPEVNSINYGTILVQTSGVPDQVFNAQGFNAQNPRFGFGNTVTLTARPSGNAIFTGWQGDCESFGTNPVCTLTNYRPVAGSNAPTSGIVQAYFNAPG